MRGNRGLWGYEGEESAGRKCEERVREMIFEIDLQAWDIGDPRRILASTAVEMSVGEGRH
jgi:hypothetical protein